MILNNYYLNLFVLFGSWFYRLVNVLSENQFDDWKQFRKFVLFNFWI